ncbi:MAG: uracil-DNA glycosylase, partial [Planctomycetota bacterium]|nr:uracil-DNA glycosylase [Planctomycetota bacterium]
FDSGSSNLGSSDPKRRRPPTLEIIDGPYPGQSLSDEARKASLVQLESEVQQCFKCPQLAEKRNHTVFGEGSVRPRVVFFGEAPGADEDRTGRPFVGAAGGLLTKMIEACKFVREDVYILNTIKCRPPNNRNPELAEREQCRGFYRQQLDLLQPEYIVCLGAVAAQELLQTKMSVGGLRGKFHQYHTSKVLVTYHPAYLLREPTRKRAAWQDLQMMLRDAKIEF